MKKILSVFLVLILNPIWSFSDVTFDAANSIAGEFDTATFSHTTADQANRLMIIGISWFDQSASGANISSITYNGVNATFLGTSCKSGCAELWYLYSPATGTNNVVVTWDSIDLGSNNVALAVCGVATFYGVNQTSGVGIPVVSTGTTSPVTVNVGGTTSGNFVVDVALATRVGGVITLTVGANQTEIWNQMILGLNNLRIDGASSREGGNGGTVTMSWTESVNVNWSNIAVELLAAATPTTTAPIESTKISLTGVGI